MPRLWFMHMWVGSHVKDMLALYQITFVLCKCGVCVHMYVDVDVCICASACMHVHMHICIQRPTSSVVLQKLSIWGLQIRWFGEPAWLETSSELPVYESQALGLQTCTTISSFIHGCSGLKWGSCTCMTRNLWISYLLSFSVPIDTGC